MKWEKLGRIFKVEKDFDWMISHASLPIAKHLGGDQFRIIFSTRDLSNHSHVGYIDINLYKLNQIVDISTIPLLSPGRLGEFDSTGTTACCEIKIKNQSYLYYTGWNSAKSVPYETFCGLARSSSLCLYEKMYSKPILERDVIDPVSIGFVTVIEDSGIYKMWYESNLIWESNNPKTGYRFVIKYAESEDGINWNKFDKICIELSKNEYVVSRPSVIKLNDTYHMWYFV